MWHILEGNEKNEWIRIILKKKKDTRILELTEGRYIFTIEKWNKKTNGFMTTAHKLFQVDNNKTEKDSLKVYDISKHKPINQSINK